MHLGKGMSWWTGPKGQIFPYLACILGDKRYLTSLSPTPNTSGQILFQAPPCSLPSFALDLPWSYVHSQRGLLGVTDWAFWPKKSISNYRIPDPLTMKGEDTGDSRAVSIATQTSPHGHGGRKAATKGILPHTSFTCGWWWRGKGKGLGVKLSWAHTHTVTLKSYVFQKRSLISWGS